MGFRDAGWQVDSVAMTRLEEFDEAGAVGRKTGDDPAKPSVMTISYQQKAAVVRH